MGYYMGDYYRGDPGFGSFLKKAAGFVGGLGIPGVSQIAKTIGGIMPGGARTAAASLPAGTISMMGSPSGVVKSVVGKVGSAIVKHPVLTAAGAAGAMGAMGTAVAEHLMGGAAGKRVLKHCHQPLKSGRMGKCHRSMNVCNPRALRRAIRRTRGFAKLAMRTIHIIHPKKKGRFGGFKKRKRT